MGNIKKRILVKIYTIWILKRIVPLMIFQILAIALALKIFADKVFVSRVLQNASQVADAGYWAFFKYLVSAFINTQPLTQIAILVGLGIGALIIRDVTRSLLTYRSMWLRK